jgi:hypothetical protein
VPYPLARIAEVNRLTKALGDVLQQYKEKDGMDGATFGTHLRAGNFTLQSLDVPRGCTRTAWTMDGNRVVQADDADLHDFGAFLGRQSAATGGAMRMDGAVEDPDMMKNFWDAEARRRCLVWNTGRLREVYHHPDDATLSNEEDSQKMVSQSDSPEVCEILQNLGLLRKKFTKSLAQRVRLLCNNTTLLADFTAHVLRENEFKLYEYHESRKGFTTPLRGDRQKHLLYVLLRRHFCKLGSTFCEIEYSESANYLV